MYHDTQMAQYVPPMDMHYVTGTWTDAAGQVSNTIVKIKSAAAETATITVPLIVPSNSAALKGSKIASVELDYEIRTAAATSITITMNKVTRGADTAVAVVSAITGILFLPSTPFMVAGTLG
jgi:hypothetical protein